MQHQWGMGEVAVVTTDNMSGMDLFLPNNVNEEDDVPLAAMFLVACACKWRTDRDFVMKVVEWFTSEDRESLTVH